MALLQGVIHRKELSTGKLLGKRRKLLPIIFCISFAALSAASYACDAQAGSQGYRVGIFVTGLPFIQKTPDGSYIGAELEIWQEIARSSAESVAKSSKQLWSVTRTHSRSWP